MPSLRNQNKFTKKYAKHIPHLLELFLSELYFVRPEIKEDKPYDVDVNLYVDYPSYLKSLKVRSANPAVRQYCETQCLSQSVYNTFPARI